MIKRFKSALNVLRRSTAVAVVAVACSEMALWQQQQASDYWADWPAAF